MPISQLRTAPLPNQSVADNSTPDALAGRAGEQITAQLHGKYYTQNYRGNVYVGTTVVAGAVPTISTSTTATFALWNPSGTTKNLVPIKLYVGNNNATTGVAGNIVYSFLTGLGAAVAGTSAVSTFTQITPINANLGAGNLSVAKFAGVAGGVVLSAAGTFLKTSGISQMATSTTAAATDTQWTAVEEFDGSLIVPPGTMLLVYGNASLASTLTMSLAWEEVPL